MTQNDPRPEKTGTVGKHGPCGLGEGTHYAGCECHEARRDAEVYRLKEELSLALKERDAYREIALAGIETLNGGVLTKGLIEATDAQAQKLSSEGKK